MARSNFNNSVFVVYLLNGYKTMTQEDGEFICGLITLVILAFLVGYMI